MDDIQTVINNAAAWITVGGFILHVAISIAKQFLEKLSRRRRRLK